MGDTLYIKFETNSRAKAGRVTIGDVASVLCENKVIMAKVKAMKLMDMPEKKGYRRVFSVMSVIERVQKENPGTEINNIGESDFIIEFDKGQKQSRLFTVCKAVLIGMVILFGSGFAIMTYNNDVDIPGLFEKIYGIVLGAGAEGNGILEISYSIGMTLGIIIFYNHFGGIRFDSDPTPIEVQMRSYETDIDNAVIDYAGRDGKEIDVG